MKQKEQFKIIMTCYDTGQSAAPYRDEVSGAFTCLEAAKAAVAQSIADELETLNAGKASDIEFVADFQSETHPAVVACRPAATDHHTIDGSSGRLITEYDIYYIVGDDAPHHAPSGHVWEISEDRPCCGVHRLPPSALAETGRSVESYFKELLGAQD